MVTGVSEGRAVITATSHNGIKETCVVNVSIRTNAIDITVVGGGKAEVSLGQERLDRARAVAIGPDGTPDSVAQEFEWRVSNSSYATIRDNGDGTATITGRKAGNVKIGAIAKDGSGVREEFSIRVIVPVASCWMMTTTKRMEAGDTTRLLVKRHARQRHLPCRDRLYLGKQR